MVVSTATTTLIENKTPKTSQIFIARKRCRIDGKDKIQEKNNKTIDDVKEEEEPANEIGPIDLISRKMIPLIN